MLSRRYSPGSTLCYTPMFHSRLFAESAVYRTQSFQAPQLDGHPAHDRPLAVQFCSNDADDLLAAARHVQAHCDAVDLNLGCPQAIAKKGRYGAFLQEDWPLIGRLIGRLHGHLDVPVTAKMRILATRELTLAYAQMVVAAGAQVLAVHARTREQKGHNTGLADWAVLRFLRDRLPSHVVLFANGNILWAEDVDRCLAATGVDGVMCAEANLHNPATFHGAAAEGQGQGQAVDWDRRFPRVDRVARDYLEIIRTHVLPHLPLQELLARPPEQRSRRQLNDVHKDANLTSIKSHLFRLWHALLPRFPHLREMVGRASTRQMGPAGDDPLHSFEQCVAQVEAAVAAELARNPEPVDALGHWVGPDREMAGDGTGAGAGAGAGAGEGMVVDVGAGRWVRRLVPWYRCQPYVRPLPAVAQANGALKPKADRTGARAAAEGGAGAGAGAGAGEGGTGRGEGETGKGEGVRSGEELPGRGAKKARMDG